MIIKIEELEGKIIKRVIIDISFDEDGNSTTKVQHGYTTQELCEIKPKEPVDALSPVGTVVSISDTIMSSTSSVAHTESSNIPKEMLDIQF